MTYCGLRGVGMRSWERALRQDALLVRRQFQRDKGAVGGVTEPAVGLQGAARQQHDVEYGDDRVDDGGGDEAGRHAACADGRVARGLEAPLENYGVCGGNCRWKGKRVNARE